MRKNSGRAEHSLAAFKPQTHQHENTEGVIIVSIGKKNLIWVHHKNDESNY